MTAYRWRPDAVEDTTGEEIRARSPLQALRSLCVAAGLGAAVLFIVVGLRYGLQEYGDGSIFSYAVAVRDAWAFHWHNISGRLFVYLWCFVPAETYVALTGNAPRGIDLYGVLFFSAQLLGLCGTYLADGSRGRIIFSYACVSTAILCPLVFGAPTEMWMAHALFWPALALCHYGRRSIAGFAFLLAVLMALVLTHEGAVVLAFAILATALLRGFRDAAFLRAGCALFIALLVWAAVKLLLRPDAYFASILPWAELNFINLSNLDNALVMLLLAAVAGFGLAFVILLWLAPRSATLGAGVMVAIALTVYWLRFDQALQTQNRYYMRTALLFTIPVLGALAALYALRAEGRLTIAVPWLSRLLSALASNTMARALTGAVALVLLVHAVETAKFVAAWTRYKVAVRQLATGEASDPALGDPRFVSSARIGQDLNRLSWPSTTQFLSVLVAPGLAPDRLVVDPTEQYFWLACSTATANEQADRAVPVQSRNLIRVHACLHR
jgi:hypothetical protein